MFSDSHFDKGQPGSPAYFTGSTYVTPLLARDRNNDFSIANVIFEPGARTHWHTHPKGQVLIVTAGEGFYQEKGEVARPLKEGDVINIPEHVEHWHGATSETALVHIAITNYKGEENVIWLQAVTNDEYRSVQGDPV